MRGLLVAFEGLDQSGKQTQAEALYERVESRGRACKLLSFPAYETTIGQEIHGALHEGRPYGPDVTQLLYIANRYERKPLIQQWLAEGMVVICDRYVASSVAYGEALGLDPDWITAVQKYLPPADLTILLDIAPETAARRKASNRDRYERDLALLSRVRESYTRQARQPGWLLIDGERPKEAVARDVLTAFATRLAQP
jgi:dTMP kinase